MLRAPFKILSVLAFLTLSNDAHAIGLFLAMDGCPTDVTTGMCVATAAMCAPEVKEGNLRATDRVLATLSAGELQDEPKFKAMVQKGSKLKGDKKIEFYMKQIGIESNSELVEFAGARELDPKYIQQLSFNTGLTTDQSEKVLGQLSTALLGGLK
jgi:hypothetical protein